MKPSPARSRQFFRLSPLFLAQCAVGMLTTNLVLAGSGIGVSLSDTNYVIGQESAPVLSITAFSNEGATVDVHVILMSPNGTIYEFPNWVANDLTPALSAFTLPPGFDLSSFPIGNLGSFSGLTTGNWNAGAVLTQPGTLNFVSTPSVVPFTVSQAAVVGEGTTYGSVHLTRYESVLPVVGTTEISTSAGAYFGRLTGSQSLINEYLQEPGLDQCVYEEFGISDLPTGVTEVDLDAGDPIQLVRSGGSTVNLNKSVSAFENHTYISYAPTNYIVSNDFYQGGASYTFQGPGGSGVGSFSVSLPAPQALVLSQPSAATTSHNAASALNLAWNAAGSQDEVIAAMTGYNMTTSKSHLITCRFVDDGSATIPANLIAQLKTGIGSGITLPPDTVLPPGIEIPGLGASATLVVERIKYQSFNTSSGVPLNDGTAVISSGVSRTLTLQ